MKHIIFGINKIRMDRFISNINLYFECPPNDDSFIYRFDVNDFYNFLNNESYIETYVFDISSNEFYLTRTVNFVTSKVELGLTIGGVCKAVLKFNLKQYFIFVKFLKIYIEKDYDK